VGCGCRFTLSTTNSWCCDRRGVFTQRAAFDQIENVAVGCILGAFREPGPFGCCQPALEAVEQAVEHFDLSLVQRFYGEAFPEVCFSKDRAQCFTGSVDGAQQAGEEPALPSSPWVSEEVLKQHGILLLEPGAQGHGVVCFPLRPGLHTVVL